MKLIGRLTTKIGPRHCTEETFQTESGLQLRHRASRLCGHTLESWSVRKGGEGCFISPFRTAASAAAFYGETI